MLGNWAVPPDPSTPLTALRHACVTAAAKPSTPTALRQFVATAKASGSTLPPERIDASATFTSWGRDDEAGHGFG
jgi:hypothetical protein